MGTIEKKQYIKKKSKYRYSKEQLALTINQRKIKHMINRYTQRILFNNYEISKKDIVIVLNVLIGQYEQSKKTTSSK